jgi:SsrA-binding protein
MANPRRNPGKITNRRAKFDYQLGDEFLVGLVLTGRETKALRLHHGQLTGAYVTDKDNELWLIGAQIMGSSAVPIGEDEITRSRKLLAKRSEIDKIIAARRDGLSAVPLELLTKGHYIKLRIALGKGKRRYDKRETLKQRQMERDARRVAR